MKAVICQQGAVKVIDVPLPQVKSNFILVKTLYSTISPGTELTSVRRNSERPSSLGYSAVGIALEIGEGVQGIDKNQVVACYGGPYVKHAEYLLVPKHLAVPVPEHVNLVEASSVGLGAIAIHALRQADVRFGECIVIVGLGILGQIIARIASASSFKVVAYDLLPERRRALANVAGVVVCESLDDITAEIGQITGGVGADSIILCASGHQQELMNRSFEWMIDRGKIVIVGDLQIEFTRSLMFRKEAQLIISRAGGPGRYDHTYEMDGFDYPIGYVRWTEGRNMQEFIRLLAEKRVNMESIMTKEVAMSDVGQIYLDYQNHPESLLGVVIKY